MEEIRKQLAMMRLEQDEFSVAFDENLAMMKSEHDEYRRNSEMSLEHILKHSNLNVEDDEEEDEELQGSGSMLNIDLSWMEERDPDDMAPKTTSTFSHEAIKREGALFSAFDEKKGGPVCLPYIK